MHLTALLYVLCFTISSVWSETNLPYFRQDDWGKCPKFPSQNDFSMKKFAGLWYYTASLRSTFANCQRMNLTATSEFEMNADLLIQNHGLVVLKVSANLDTPDHSEPAAMHWYYNLASMIHEDFTVLSTDYENYATIFQCHEFLFFHRKSFLILSKTMNLDQNNFVMGKTPVDKYYETHEIYDWRKSSNWLCSNGSETSTVEYNVGKSLKEFLQVVNSYTFRF